MYIQNSVFEGNIEESKLLKLEYELSKYIRKDIDSVIVFTNNNPKWMKKQFLGKDDEKTSNFFKFIKSSTPDSAKNMGVRRLSKIATLERFSLFLYKI